MSSKTIAPVQGKHVTPPLGSLGSMGKIVGGVLLGSTMLVSALVAGGLAGLAISFRNLPDVRALRTYTPSETTYIYDIEGNYLASLHGEANREVVPLNQISPNLKRAVLAIEDSTFYAHHGVQPISIARAMLANFKAGETVEGASTLTMQLVKNLFLSPQRTFNRKAAESILSLRLEQVFKKNEILEMYLNQVYWGHNNYGAETAAQSYFQKPASQLTLAEGAMMAGFIQAPEEWSPFICDPTCRVDSKRYAQAKERQSVVLRRMRELEWITPEEEKTALKQPLSIGQVTSFRRSKEPYITEAVIQELNSRFGAESVTQGGMRVQTTIDSQMQKAAEDAVAWGHGRFGDWGVGRIQMALIAIDPRTHYVKAMVGGVDYKESQFNRALQARRQPGSAFKPITYYTAFATGRFTPDSPIGDSPVSFRDGAELYTPQNYDNSYMGGISIRQAIHVSRNIPAVQIGQWVGVEKSIEVCRLLGVKSPMLPVISLPLGAVDMTPMELTTIFATFANYGWYSPSTFIVHVTDGQGQVLLDNTPKPQLVLDPWASAAITDAMRGVITQGTATSAQIGRPAAGKTGTTSSERDVWFVGYVPQLAAAIWIGRDDYGQLGQGVTGGTYAAPIWRDFMVEALKDTPVEDFRPMWDFPMPKSDGN